MANVAKTDVETLYTTISGSTNVSTAQIAQAQGLLYALLQSLFGPGTTSTTIKNGSV